MQYVTTYAIGFAIININYLILYSKFEHVSMDTSYSMILSLLYYFKHSKLKCLDHGSEYPINCVRGYCYARL